jgi:hypothetical protein
MPSGLVITKDTPPPMATAANNINSGDHTTDRHALSVVTRIVQVIPSGLVITLLPVPE